MFVISRETYTKYWSKWNKQYGDLDGSSYSGVITAATAKTYWYQIDQLNEVESFCPFEYISKRVDNSNNITYFGSR